MTRKPTQRRSATAQDQLVADALRGAEGPVSAYDIIDRLRDQATLAPQTVYRSLSRLIAEGQAHRLESINAFVACSHGAHDSVAVFAICEACSAVTEFHEDAAVAKLASWAARNKFVVSHTTIELRGLCGKCSVESAPSR